jgi:solute carrier family 25 (mitochondrial phosphate transporter), member 3
MTKSLWLWLSMVAIVVVILHLSSWCDALVATDQCTKDRWNHDSYPFRRFASSSLLGLSKRDSESLLQEEDSSLTERLQSTQKMAQTPLVNQRRQLLASAAVLALSPWMASAAASASSASSMDDHRVTRSLEDVKVGTGQWKTLGPSSTTSMSIPPTGRDVPASFSTYLARFLIQYDAGVSSWWISVNQFCSLMSDQQRSTTLGKAFGSFAASIHLGVQECLVQHENDRGGGGGYDLLARNLLRVYGASPDAQRHIGILAAMLPPAQQPVDVLSKLVTTTTTEMATAPQFKGRESTTIDPPMPYPPPRLLTEDLGNLLPPEYKCVLVPSSTDGDGSSRRATSPASYTIYPPISLFEVARVDERAGQPAAVLTAFGPLASNALTRELPDFSLWTYTLLGISGATGCALTHSVVIPLDVVKTKAQTNPEEYKDVIKGAVRILDQEGIQGLFTGAQATIAGYLWYGLSVYPSYTFFKRYISGTVLPPEVAAVHGNDIALLAGALAAVIASFGLTPLEAARIRVVAEPDRYKSLGLTGTLGVIAQEDARLGWKAVYAGLPSLMARQVIFGSVKFLAFERACESIFGTWPFLRDATWTALMVSLVAGGFSGTLSSIVSQPADSVLTYVARNSSGKGSLGVLEGCFLMVEKEGVGSLFRGLGSRCVWAGSIIAGQFLLYDIFRTSFGVSGQDLSQVFQIVISGS